MMYINGQWLTEDGWVLNECSVFVDLEFARFYMKIPRQMCIVDEEENIQCEEEAGVYEITPGITEPYPATWYRMEIESGVLPKGLIQISPNATSVRRKITDDYQPAW